MAGDGPSVSPEQLAMMDQLNQKLANAEITAAEYAEAIKQAGLETAHAVTQLDKMIAKFQTLLGNAQDLGLALSDVQVLQDSLNSAQSEQNGLMDGTVSRADLIRQRAAESKNASDELTDAQKALNDELQNANVWGADFLMKLAQGKGPMEALIGKAATLGGALETIGAGALEAMRDAFILNIGAADNMQASFNKMSGQAGAMNDTILTAHRGVGSLGVGMEEAGAAATALYQDFNQFSSASSSLQTEMIQTTASLENLGISSATTAGNIALATNAFGMTAQEATALQDDLAKTAMAIGMPPATLAAEFAKAAPQLSVYGQKGIEVFKNMAAASKGLGIEMGTLLNLTGQFDTFEGAASAAGNLNSILGGDLLNSMDMLNATEDERIRMILQSVDASGKSWASMGKFEKMAVANAAGITDMAEANKLFGGGLKGYDDAQKKMAENAKTEAELAEAKAAAVSMADKMKLIMQQLAVALQPVINFVHFLLNGVLRLNDAFGGMLLPVLAGGIAVIYAIAKAYQFMLFYKKLTNDETIKGLMNGTKEVAASGASAAAKGVEGAACGALATCKKVEKAATDASTRSTNMGVLSHIRAGAVKAANTVKTWALIAAEKAAAAAKWLVAKATLFLSGVFGGQATAQGMVSATAQPAAMGTAKMGAASAGAAGPVLALGIGIGLLALGFGLFAIAVAWVVSSFVKLIGLFMQSPAAIGPMIVGLVLLSYAIALMTTVFAALAPIAPVAAAAMITLGVGMLALSVPLMLVSVGMAMMGKALQLMNPAVMLQVAMTLPIFAWAILASVVPMGIAASVFAPAAIAVGIGLAAIGLGLMVIAPNVVQMVPVATGLMALGWGLLAAVVPMAMAAVPFAWAAVALGIGLAAIGLGMILISPYVTQMIPVATGLMALGWGLLVATIPLAAAATSFVPAAVLVAVGLAAIGLGLILLAPHTTLMATIGLNLFLMAIGLYFAAPFLLAGGILLSAAAIPFLWGATMVGIGLWFLGTGVQQFSGLIPTMLGVSLAIIPFAIAMLIAAPILFSAGLWMIIAGIPFLIGAWMIGTGIGFLAKSAEHFPALLTLPLVAAALIVAAPLLFWAGIYFLIAGGPFLAGALMIGIGMWALSWAAPQFPNMLLFPEVAFALMLAAPMLYWAGIAMLMAGPSFIIGAVLIAFGMAILNAPLMQFAQAIALMGPFIPALPALALGLIMLGFALPIFGFGLLMLGIVASLPFFSTGLDVLTEALYVFADAMSGIPTEKAVALGQIFQGLGGLTDMDGVGAALFDFSWGVMFLGYALGFMPDGATLNLMAEGLKMFAETGAKHVLPVSIALYAAAPYLLAAAFLLAPAAFWLMIAGPPLAAAMFWIAMAFGFFGDGPAKAGLKEVGKSFLPAAIGLFLGAPMLFFATIWLWFAAPFFFIAAFFIAMGMAVLNEPLREFAITMLMMAPIAAMLPAIAYGLWLLGTALPTLGWGLFWLGFFASMPFFQTGLSVLSDALYVFADAMSTIPTEKAVALGQIFQGLAAMTDMEAMADGLYSVAGAIWFLSWIMGTIPEETLMKMKMVFDYALDPLNNLAANMTPEVVTNAAGLVSEAERYGTVQATMKSFDEDAFAQAVVGAAKAAGGGEGSGEKGAGGGEGGGGKGHDVVLVLNEREFGRAIEVYMNKRIPLGVS